MNQMNYGSIVVKSPAMLQVLHGLMALKSSDLIFIVGCKGSGKSMLAQHLQQTVFRDQNVRISDAFDASAATGIFTLNTPDWENLILNIKSKSFNMIAMPSLSDRRLDIQALAEFFLQVLSLMHNKPKVKLTEKALEKILQYGWPGQFYEFEEILENAFVLAMNGLIEPEYLMMGPLSIEVGVPTGMKLDELERKYILQTLYFVHQNRTKAAEILGISIRTLRNKINQYRVEGYL